MNDKFRKIKTGVIGVGSMGKNHVRILSEVSNLIGVSDNSVEAGQEVASKFKTIFFEDYTKLLEKVDAVVIAVPTEYHLDLVKKVADFGVHMLVEKPIASNPKDAKLIIDICKRNNLTLAVGHIERHNPVVRFAKNQIEKGIWGDIITASAQRFSNYPVRIRDVGVVYDTAIHDIDSINYLFNMIPVSVYCSGGRFNQDVFEDHVNINMEYENATFGYVETNWLTPTKVRKLFLNFTKKFVELDYISQSAKIIKSDIEIYDSYKIYDTKFKISEELPNIVKEEPLKLELLDFLNSVDSQTSPLVDGHEALNAVIVAEAALRSLSSKSRILLKDV